VSRSLSREPVVELRAGRRASSRASSPEPVVER
jgi:hypothetical protein